MEKPPKTCKDLQNALYDDWKRKAIDTAKKKAVAQHVDYDTFKNMVLVAHLKPIQAPNSRQNVTSAPAWNFSADGQPIKEDQQEAGLEIVRPAAPPSTSGDFQREWRRNCPTPEDKYRYLKLCTPAALPSIFKVEVNSEVLGEILQVLETCWLTAAGLAQDSEDGAHAALQEAVFVFETLSALTTAGRFSLNVRLLAGKYKEAAKALFCSVLEAAQAAEVVPDDLASQRPANFLQDIDALCKVYGVKLL